MAPSSTEDTDIVYILDALTLAGEAKPDWTALAAEKGISHRNNAYRKFRDILKKHGFGYENGRIARIGEQTEVGTETPKKETPKKSQDKAKLASKKRKLQGDGEASAGNELDEVKEEREREGLKNMF